MKYKHQSHVVFTELNGEIAILNSKTGIYFTLDDVGAFIWQLLNQPMDEMGLTKLVTDEYEIDEETAKQDIQELLQHLIKEELVEEI